MFFVAMNVLCSSALITVLKLFKTFKINTFQAVVVNYLVCVVTGSLFLGHLPAVEAIAAAPWFGHCVLAAFLFIIGFFMVGNTAQIFGLAISSIMQKMSLLISVPFAVLMFGDSISALKIIGLCCALAALVLANIRTEATSSPESSAADAPRFNKWLLFFPIYIFFNGGFIECTIQYAQRRLFTPNTNDEAYFSLAAFGMAGMLGVVVVAIGLLLGKMRFAARDVLAGIVLGIPNYFSIFFLLKSFGALEPSTALATSNISTVTCTVLIGFLAFRERLSTINWLGIGMALLAISLLAWG